MITISELLVIDNITFNKLFTASYARMEEGTMPWQNLGVLNSIEEREKALKEVFDSSCGWPNSKVIIWKKDDVPIHIAAGSIFPENPLYIHWNYAVYGPDANNSKSWLYEESYITQTKEYLKNTFGILGYQISCVKGSSLYNYHKNKPNSASFYEITEELSEDGVIAIITYTYK